jgi:hypothetical protein
MFFTPEGASHRPGTGICDMAILYERGETLHSPFQSMKGTCMRMSREILMLLLIALTAAGWQASVAQVKEPQSGDTTTYKTIIPEVKQGLLKNVSMIANMQFALRNEFVDGDYTLTRFRNEQFRLEIRGQVHEKVYFRFRDRYTRAQTSESIDNLSRSVDLAFVRVTLSDKFSLSGGKMCADWGGYEFDYNPIDIYEYSDIIEYADNFLTGVGVSYQASSAHQFTLQALDSRTKSFDELYGAQPDFIEAKAPLAFVANWRGSLFDGKFNTIWAYAVHNEAKNTLEDKPGVMHYIALGNQLKLDKFTVEYDFKWSVEDLDRTGIVTLVIPDALYPYAVEKTDYVGHWLHLYYRASPELNFALVLMADIAKWKDDLDPQKTSNDIRTAYGFIPTIEYFPFNDLNFRFFANYVGRSYVYSDYAKTRFGAADNTTGRFNIGIVSPLGIF